MLADRGWTPLALSPDQQPTPPLDISDFYGVYATATGDPHPRAVVLNFDHPRRQGNIVVKDVRGWCGWMEITDTMYAVIISREKLNSFIVKELASLPDITVNMMTTENLKINPTDSPYYVPHARLPTIEGDGIKKKYGQLPQLPHCDPIVRYFGWCVGDVIKICRNYGGFEFTDMYREIVY